MLCDFRQFFFQKERIFLKKAQLRKPLRNLKMTVNRFNKADTLFITIGFVCLCVVFLSIVCMMGRKPVEIDQFSDNARRHINCSQVITINSFVQYAKLRYCNSSYQLESSQATFCSVDNGNEKC